MVASLAASMRPCGPVLAAGLAGRDRTFETLDKAAAANGWSDVLASARAALDPVFAAAPYLSGLARRRPAQLAAILRGDPAVLLSDLLARTTALAFDPLDLAVLKTRLRELKAEIHLLTALADLGGVWDLDQVTGALTRFADASVNAAMTAAVRAEVERGRLIRVGDGEAGPLPGLFCIAMGKYGAFELNYSSDIDISLFYEPDALPLAEGIEHQGFTTRFAKTLADILQERTSDGYVFRVDLRLRPDPSSTPPALPVDAALDYYQTVGQNWERAAFIKARICAGDFKEGQAFLDTLQPFIWRRNLDYAAIADIHSIKRQIHIHKVDERLTAKGADVKLGHGGIREIEFFVQTQQLIMGGRDPSLRSNRTVDALAALAKAGRISPDTAADLTQYYADLRALEHRAQMVADEQTHKLPETDSERAKIAALSGDKTLSAFDARVERLLRAVNSRYGELFSEDEDLSSSFGSLVFTGVEDDPETLRTLKRMGYSEPARVSGTIRSWHHGRIGATRTEQGRELFTRLAPRLLEAAQATGAPDEAFRRFADFFASLTMGVQVQSLFLAQPKLFELIVRVMAFAPRLAAFLARSPAALDSLMDTGFFAPFAEGEIEAALSAGLARGEPGYEAAMDTARRLHREQGFRIGVQVMSGAVSAAEAGPAFADLADACIRGLAGVALAEVERLAGAFPGEVAVIALGKCGSREMTAGSDLDLMTVYRADAGAASALKGLTADTFYARFTQRLIAALSAPTAEGGLYEVDMRLRPSGTAGPVAVNQAAFKSYYAGEAETWEFLALTRARVVWASTDAFAAVVAADIEAALRQPRDAAATAKAVREMRALMATELPPTGFWDLKRSPGGLIDIEFAAQHLQILHAASGGPLRPNTGEALAAIRGAGLLAPKTAGVLHDAWRLQQDLSQLLKVALAEDADPSSEPAAFKALLAKAGGCDDFETLRGRLRSLRIEAHRAFESLVTESSAAKSARATD
jgi:[glutamine synthetase] adenylyltransferase / [glutamine synthetase]-adenylyl-L-tyrosine phosphorylase